MGAMNEIRVDSAADMQFDENDLLAVREILRKAELRTGESRDDEGTFLARELTYVRGKTYAVKYPALRGLSLIPIDTDVSEWAEFYVTKTFDQVGMAKVIANYADDLPRADVTRAETISRVRDIGDSYGYNIAELRASASPYSSVSLPAAKAASARRAIDVKLNAVAMRGDAMYGLNGLLTHPNISVVALTGNWSSATDGSTIYADLVKMFNNVFANSWGVHQPTTALFAPDDFAAMTSKMMPGLSGLVPVSAWEFFSKNYPGVRAEQAFELTNADPVTGKNVKIMGEITSDVLSLVLPMPFNQLPAQARNLELVVPCLARTGGVDVRYPLALVKAIG